MQMAGWFCCLLHYTSPQVTDTIPLVTVDGSWDSTTWRHPTSFSQQLLLTSPYDTHKSEYVLKWVAVSNGISCYISQWQWTWGETMGEVLAHGVEKENPC